MTYILTNYSNLLLLHVYFIMAEPYIYYLIWTKCIHNLCVHMYIWVSDSFYEVVDSVKALAHKTRNVGLTSKILELPIYFEGSVLNLTSAVMMLVGSGKSHNDRCREDPTLTRTLTSNAKLLRFSNVDSGYRVWCPCW